MAFDEQGAPKRNQVAEMVEARVLDEVTRYARLYAASADQLKGGLSYFTFSNTYDRSINLSVGGASGMPSVMRFIYSVAAAG